MAEGTFGGNGSVVWSIDCDHLKGNPQTTDNGGHHHHHGHCGTPPGADFEIAISRPRGQGADTETERVATGLESAAKLLRQGRDAIFYLRVEKSHHRQVVVSWETADENFNPDSAV